MEDAVENKYRRYAFVRDSSKRYTVWIISTLTGDRKEAVAEFTTHKAAFNFCLKHNG